MVRHSTCAAMAALLLRMYSCMHRGIFPITVRHRFHRHPRNMYVHPLVKPLQDLQHLPHNHLTFAAAQQHCLRQCLIHYPTGLHHRSRLFQHPQNRPLPYPRFLQVMEHCRPTTIVISNHPPKLGEGL